MTYISPLPVFVSFSPIGCIQQASLTLHQSEEAFLMGHGVNRKHALILKRQPDRVEFGRFTFGRDSVPVGLHGTMSQQKKARGGRLSLKRSSKSKTLASSSTSGASRPNLTILSFFDKETKKTSEDIKNSGNNECAQNDVFASDSGKSPKKSPYFAKNLQGFNKSRPKVKKLSVKQGTSEQDNEQQVIDLTKDITDTVGNEKSCSVEPVSPSEIESSEGQDKYQNMSNSVGCKQNNDLTDMEKGKKRQKESVGSSHLPKKRLKLGNKSRPTDEADKKKVETTSEKSNSRIIGSGRIDVGESSEKQLGKSNDDGNKSLQNEPEQDIPKPDKIKTATTESHDDQVKFSEADKESETNEYQIPYYLEYFHTIVKSVLTDEYYARLFSEDDLATISKFQALSEQGQKLYIRLFQRKLRWLRDSQIDYPSIAQDLSPFFEELLINGFLQDESKILDLKDVLVTMQAPVLRSLARSYRLPVSEQRPVIIEAIQKHAKQKSIGSFFSAGRSKDGSTNEASIMKRGLALLGKCYRIDEDNRWVFLRVMMLFSFHNITWEEDQSSNTQLFQMLMANIGRMTYPKYSIHRVTQVFRDRHDLLAFCSAVQMEADIREAVDGNHIDEALEINQQVKSEMENILKDDSWTEHVESLPEHLSCYTPGAVYVRALTQGVEALQKKRNYKEAVKQLEALIEQPYYRKDYRGRWYDRLALNVHTHLKKPEQALDIIQKALSDPSVRFGHRYSIWQRAQKICSGSGTKKLHHHWDSYKEDIMVSVKDAPTVTITGKQLSVPGALMRWCTEETFNDSTGEVTFVKNVEDVALRHYAQHGYPQGLHGESSTISIFFSLFMWDILFSGVPDAFINPYQTMPLDLYTDNFYKSRKDVIDSRISWMNEASVEELEAELERKWTENEGTICVGINWERFDDLSHAQGLLRCMGGKVLAAMCDRMVKCLRFTRSGFPDLTVWNTETNQFKIVEVKGPGDRLSTKQILWLDFLVGQGVDAEVCYVTAVAAKRLRISR